MQVAGTGGCENSFLWSLESPPAENCLHHELRFASDALKRDPEVVLTAVRRNALSLESPDSILFIHCIWTCHSTDATKSKRQSTP